MGQQPPAGGTKKRAPALRKSIMLDTTRGAPRARQWPRGRNIRPGSGTAERNERFRIAQQFIKYLTAREQSTVADAVKGTPLMPRDVLTMLVYIRCFQLGPGGPGTVYSMATRRDVSESLDALGNTAGFGLQRGAEFWEAVPLSGGGGGMVWNWPAGSAPGINPLYSAAFQGAEYDCFQSMQVAQMATWVTFVSGGSYQVAIAEVDTGSTIQAIDTSAAWAATASYTGMHVWDLDATLSEGKRYALLIGRTDQGTTYVMPIPWQAPAIFNAPLQLVRRVSIASTAPAVGNSLTQIGASARGNFTGLGASF